MPCRAFPRMPRSIGGLLPLPFREGGRGVGQRGLSDFREASGQIIHDPCICQTQHAEATRGKDPVTLGIVYDLRIMHTAVHFDDQPDGVAIEIDDEAIDDLLATEMESMQPARTDVIPQSRLGRCHRVPQLPRPLALLDRMPSRHDS